MGEEGQDRNDDWEIAILENGKLKKAQNRI